jgi:serine phosphatase RsbU (regulator of sigma subunit)
LGQAVERVRRRQAERENAEVQRAMSEAFQRSLLPLPVGAGGPSVAVRYQPAVELTRIGGDWYDWFELPDDSLVLVIGDVAGHDERAAAAMAQVRNVLHGVAYTALSGTPGTVLRGVDRALLGSTRGILATALLARVTRTAAEAGLDVEWSNTGHPAPVLVSPDGRARLLETEPDLLLGLDEDVERQNHHLHLQAGATLVLYTDGLIERRDAPISQGLSWLAEVLADTHEMDPEKLCDFLLDAADASEDDVALLVLRA